MSNREPQAWTLKIRVGAWAGILAIALYAGLTGSWAQTADPAVLAEQSPIVVLGTVTKVNASEEPLLAATNSTAVIQIEKMYAGAEFAGDQTGHSATVILSKPGSVRAGSRFLFFGHPRYVGKTLTIADTGEIPQAASGTALVQTPTETALLQGIQKRRDAPIRTRLALADMVFRGKVESVRPLESAPATNERNPQLREEHDPDWQVAMVQVTSAVRGTKNGTVVPVIFPASGDILWVNTPKLHPGEEVLVLGHRPQQDELRLFQAAKTMPQVDQLHAEVVSKPFDVLPLSEEKRLTGLMQEVK